MSLDLSNIVVISDKRKIFCADENRMIVFSGAPGSDGRGIEPKGSWSADVAYNKLDLVTYNGNFYLAMKYVPAGTAVTNTDYWMSSLSSGSIWGKITGTLSDQTDLQDALDGKASVIENSASGALASFSDGAPAPVSALSVNIEPVQSGSGDPAPDNVRPITGHSEAKVTRTGKNLFGNLEDGYIESGGTIHAPGAPAEKYTPDYIPVGSATQIRFQVWATNHSVDGWFAIGNYDANKKWIIRTNNSATFTNNYATNTVSIASGAKYIRLSMRTFGSDTLMAEFDQAASVYEPYSGTSVTIDLDGTRYGGSINVLTGEMKVNRAYVLLNDSAEWEDKSAFFQYNQFFTDRKIYSDSYTGLICSAFPCKSSATIKGRWRSADSPAFTIQGGNGTYTLAQIQAMATNGDIAICYPIATPVTVQLDPETLTLLAGTNNVWASTGDVEVGYKADTKLYIDGKVAELQALILEH